MSRPNLIVDGYNVIHASWRYMSLASSDMRLARERLVTDVSVFGSDRFRCTVVFDGTQDPFSDGAPRHVLDVGVIFSAAGASADDVVEALAARSRERGAEATVVTSDGETRRVVSGRGVSVMTATRFIDEVEAMEAQWRSSGGLSSSGPTLDGRIDPRVRETMARWARGEPSDGASDT